MHFLTGLFYSLLILWQPDILDPESLFLPTNLQQLRKQDLGLPLPVYQTLPLIIRNNFHMSPSRLTGPSSSLLLLLCINTVREQLVLCGSREKNKCFMQNNRNPLKDKKRKKRKSSSLAHCLGASKGRAQVRWQA